MKHLILFAFLSCTWAHAGDKTILYSMYDDKASYVNRVELRAIYGQDLSDPYADHFSWGNALFWQISEKHALGLEASVFSASEDPFFSAQLADLKKYGVEVVKYYREYQARFLHRLTFIRGYWNFFSLAVLPMELSLNNSLGAVGYRTSDPHLHVGAALEFNLGFGKDWGMFVTGFWDADSLPGNSWLYHFGFTVGPRVRM